MGWSLVRSFYIQIRRQQQSSKSQSAGLARGSLAWLAVLARAQQLLRSRPDAGQRWRPCRIDDCSWLV